MAPQPGPVTSGTDKEVSPVPSSCSTPATRIRAH